MGVVNVSPESRNRQTIAATPAEAGTSPRAMPTAGADLIDLGAQSSHYEEATLTPEEEWSRLAPALHEVLAAGLPVSVDTWKPEVARRAIGRGCVAGERHREACATPPWSGCSPRRASAGVAMRIDGTDPHRVRPLDMSGDVPGRIFGELARLLEDLEQAGVTNLLLDPGIAINYPGDYSAYTRLQLEVIRRLAELRPAGASGACPDSPQTDAGGDPRVCDSVPRARRRCGPGPRCRRCGDARGAIREKDALSRLLHIKGPADAGAGERQEMLELARSFFGEHSVAPEDVVRVDVPGRGGSEGSIEGASLRRELEPLIPALQSTSLFGNASGGGGGRRPEPPRRGSGHHLRLA